MSSATAFTLAVALSLLLSLSFTLETDGSEMSFRLAVVALFFQGSALILYHVARLAAAVVAPEEVTVCLFWVRPTG